MPVRTIHVLVALVLSLAPSAAEAFRLEPISRVFDPSGSGATQTFTVHNTSNQRIAIEVTIATLERDADYRESNRKADDEFLVYPSQLIVAPGQRRTVRVKWLGDPAPRAERAFRIVVEELPIELVEPGQKQAAAPRGALRILMTYRGSLWVRPRGARPRIAVESAAPVKGTDGSNRLAITLRNRGTANAVLSRCRGTLRARGATTGVLLHPDALDALSKSRILAGGRRRYTIAWPGSMALGPISARVSCALAR